MKKDVLLILFSFGLVIISIWISLFPKEAEALGGKGQWIEVQCDDLNGTVDCNDCIAGEKNCFDHTCTSCYGGGIGL
ncbi:hypothetical protein [Algoriphagus formosus]|jgi:hypothetical protein|uniref:Transmembrane protein n=1 Tax=Algoriphagus formosus TaxID=2007308 RepID=A0A4R5VFL5_9BACT|nr:MULTISPECIES: hypothetical protein [Algoriphagus]TDK51297.1 hypothetical protein E1898_00115 [Algoriphagus aquimaris]